MRRSRKPTRFSQIRYGAFAAASGPRGDRRPPEKLRLSSALAGLRAMGEHEAADKLAAAAKEAAPFCPQCQRELPDPVIGLVPGNVAFACPWCSGEGVLRAWEAEGEANEIAKAHAEQLQAYYGKPAAALSTAEIIAWKAQSTGPDA